MRKFVLFLALLTCFLVPLPATAAPGGSSDNFPARIDLPKGFAPEGIESGKGTSVFVGSLIDGAIWRGDLRTGEGEVFAEGAPGRASVGIAYEASRDRLWVAGGGAAVAGVGDVRVYDASSGDLLAAYNEQSGVSGVGFLNDVTITKDAVYVTDSTVSELVVISLAADGSLPAAATKLPLTGDFEPTAGFNLNGIVSSDDVLIVGQSSTGKLFRVDPATGATDEVELSGAGLPLINADGLELHGHTLYAVRNMNNLVAVVRLGAQFASGIGLGEITDPGLDIPTTATVAAGRLWAVNARFGTAPAPDTEYWITQLPLHP
ncbi:MAG TPA: superoxide dismutase [Propionibacteriaceae bacterium]|nr:superoxide dismutase [Propionibacteriaceae bacterium]